MDAVERCRKIRKGGKEREAISDEKENLKRSDGQVGRVPEPIFPTAMNDNVTDGGFYYLLIHITIHYVLNIQCIIQYDNYFLNVICIRWHVI